MALIRLRKRRFAFRLATLLAMVLPCAFASILLVKWIENRPIEWTPYSDAALKRHLADGSTVLVFFSAKWDVNSMVAEQVTFNDRQVRTLVWKNRISMLFADCTLQNSEAETALKRFHGCSTPTIAIYHPGVLDSPCFLYGLRTPKDLLAQLRDQRPGNAIQDGG